MERDLRFELVELLPRLRRFGIALTRSAVHADDLVQAACERALMRQGQLRHETKIGVWMYSIMRNLWIDEIRAPRSHLHDSIEAARDVIGDDGEDLTEKNNTWAAVRRALGELPAEQRAALILICVNGISYKETAKILDIPLGTVTRRVARARRALYVRLATRSAGGAPLLPHRRSGLSGAGMVGGARRNGGGGTVSGPASERSGAIVG
jgi:RNA polymerase sigma-70 factor (ECF subfamily)